MITAGYRATTLLPPHAHYATAALSAAIPTHTHTDVYELLAARQSGVEAG